jgi:hypothetical protein
MARGEARAARVAMWMLDRRVVMQITILDDPDWAWRPAQLAAWRTLPW